MDLNPKRTFEDFLELPHIPVDVLAMAEAHVSLLVPLGQLVTVYKKRVIELVNLCKTQEKTIIEQTQLLNTVKTQLSKRDTELMNTQEALNTAQKDCDNWQLQLKAEREQFEKLSKVNEALLSRLGQYEQPGLK